MVTQWDQFLAYKPPKIPPIGRVCKSILFSPSLWSSRQPPVVQTQAPRVPIRCTRSHRTPSLSSTRPIGLCFWVAIRESLLRAPFRWRRFHAIRAPSSPGGRVEILESSSLSSSGTICSFLIYSTTRERCGAGQICHARAIHRRHSTDTKLHATFKIDAKLHVTPYKLQMRSTRK